MKRTFWIPTGLLAATALLASFTYGNVTTARAAAPKKASAASSAALIARGKALTTQYHCNGCHGADFMGKPGRTPNITPTGELKNYNKETFERLLDTGVKDDHKPLHGMPVLNLPASKSDAIWAYLHTLK